MAAILRRASGGSRILKVAIVGLVAATLVGAGFAYTASNTVQETKGGEGSNTISGFNVASVHYNLNAADPTKVDSLTFTLDSVPAVGSTVRVRITAAGSWYNCTNSGVNVSCATTSPAATLGTTDQLSVVVAQ